MKRGLGGIAALLSIWPISAAIGQTCNTADRSVLLILDSSGSMNAKLPNGETRIDVARRAIKGVASEIPGEAQIALRLYGSQSPRQAKNCRDTTVAVPFAAARDNGASIVAAVDQAVAQGYTPIAHSLGRSVGDFAAPGKERIIVLVSDGKETCDGDPALAAKALADQGITVHAVGFLVDTTARMQLQAVARATGGSYFDAPVGPDLPAQLTAALNACKVTLTVPQDPEPGKLRTSTATFPHAVIDAETGEKVGTLDRVTHELTLPAGIYEVKFGPGSWKGIEVRSGETTLIEPATLELTPTTGVRVVDSETGVEFGKFDRVTPSLSLLPGVYDLRFGKTEWRFIKVDGGKTTTLRPVEIRLARELKWKKKARVATADGTEVFRFDAVTKQAVLPPGDYVIEIDDNRLPFPAAEGAVLDINPQ